MWLISFVDAFLSTAGLCFVISGLGITAGAHRLWSHRSYKASLPLKIFLSFANSMAFQVLKKEQIVEDLQPQNAHLMFW